MKKLLLSVSALFLFGCGTGGTNTASNTGTNPGGNPETPGNIGPLSTVTLKIAEEAPRASKSVAMTTMGASNSVRVVVRDFDTVNVPVYEQDEEGNPTDVVVSTIPKYTELFRYVRDYDLTGTSLQVEIPVGTHTIDILTNKKYLDAKGKEKHIMHKYGRVMEQVIAPGTTITVEVKDLSEIIAIKKPDVVTADSNYSVTVFAKYSTNKFKAVNGMPFANNCKFRQDPTQLVFDNYSSKNAIGLGSSYTFKAPKVYGDGTVAMNLYFTGQFFINDSMLTKNSTELFTNWTRTYPETAFSESVTSSLTPLLIVDYP